MRARDAILALLALGIGSADLAEAQRSGSVRFGRPQLSKEGLAQLQARRGQRQQEGPREWHHGMGRADRPGAFAALDLSAAQKEQLQGLREQFQAERRARLESGERPTQEEIASFRAAHRQALAQILTSEQLATLEQFRVDRQARRAQAAGDGRHGMGRGSRREVFAALDLSATQKEQLQGLREQFQAERRARRESGERPTQEEIASFRAAHRQALAEILTPEQLATLEQLRDGSAGRRPGLSRHGWRDEAPGGVEDTAVNAAPAGKAAGAAPTPVEASSWGRIKKEMAR